MSDTLLETSPDNPPDNSPVTTDAPQAAPMRPVSDAANPADSRHLAEDAQAQGTVEKPAADEIGGQPGPEPTRYGDWEKNGRCTDF